jgi:hypothetical protein
MGLWFDHLTSPQWPDHLAPGTMRFCGADRLEAKEARKVPTESG